MQLEDKKKRFYEMQYLEKDYARGIHYRAENKELEEFVRRYNLRDKKVLEIGCGRGAFQDLVNDYTGVDITSAVEVYMQKPFVVANAENLPFKESTFDAIWSITTLEHVQDPQKTLEEIQRVLKPSGLAYLAPAWHVRDWTSDGYEVRPYSDFGWKGKLIKILIPLRNNLFYRAVICLPFRIIREIQYLFCKRTQFRLHYKKLKPNYEKYWCADSDACCSLDPHEMLLWFKCRKWKTPSHPNWFSRFFVRHGAIIVQKP